MRLADVYKELEERYGYKVDDSEKNVTKLVKIVVDGEEKELSEEVVVSITADKVEHTVEFIYE